MNAEGRSPTLFNPRTDREFELQPAHVISAAANGVVHVLVHVERLQRAVSIVRHCAEDAGANSANIESAKAGIEEAIGQADRIASRSRAIFAAAR